LSCPNAVVLMKSFIVLPYVRGEKLPEKFQDEDIRSSPSAVELFIEEFTWPGDTVFDPFAGYGTTLLVAERMERIPFGIELDEGRYEYARSKLTAKDNLLLGDSRKMDTYEVPKADLVFTSPIFMGCDETVNPLSGFKEPGDYSAYLEQLQDIFRQTARVLNPGARVVVEAFNLRPRNNRPMTLLAWDMARAISEVLSFEKEVVVCWEGLPSDSELCRDGYDHHYCLVFESKD
jgi:SAM-dependent methyltransferase